MTFSGNADNGPRKSSLNFDNVLNLNFDQQRIKARGLGSNPNTCCRQIANIKGISEQTEDKYSRQALAGMLKVKCFIHTRNQGGKPQVWLLTFHRPKEKSNSLK